MNDIIIKEDNIIFPEWFSYFEKQYPYFNKQENNNYILISFSEHSVDTRYSFYSNKYGNKLHVPCVDNIYIYKDGYKYITVDGIKVNYEIFYYANKLHVLINNNFSSNYRAKHINTYFVTYGLFNKNQLEFASDINDTDSFYYPLSITEDLKIKYLTKSKYIEYVYNGINKYDKYTREITLAKFLINHCEWDKKEVSVYIEKIKTLNQYNPDNFEIVTGDDILKYYDKNNYYNRSGSLNSSCMRTADHENKLRFYTKNSNISLIIFKLNDKILGRALLWTTTTGEKVMDRIYVNDDKCISHFHKFAEEMKFLNIYDFKIPCNSKTTKFQMAPGNWKHDFKRNFVVDLEYLPYFHYKDNPNDKPFRSIIKDKQDLLYISTDKSQTVVNNIQPYLDNFCFVNYFTEQISNLSLEDFYKCPLSKEYVNDLNSALFHKNKMYNADYVTIVDNKAVLKKSLVTQNDQQVIENLPINQINVFA